MGLQRLPAARAVAHPWAMATDSPPFPNAAPVEWRRSRRARRISLRLDARSGRVVLTLPARATKAAGLQALQTHAGWIAERLRRLPEPVRFADGAAVPVHGVPHRIRHLPGACGRIGDGEVVVGGGAEFLSRRVVDLLRAEALRALSAQACAKAACAGLRVRRVVVKDTRSRWGSCTADGTLMFSWRLVMAPAWVQDYVAAHEAAHLRHMNHGAEFWALADTLSPHRRMAEAWLRAEGPGLQRVG